MTQGDPISIATYGIGVLPLIKLLKAEFTDITQPWYVDDTGALIMFSNVELYFNLLKRFGPGCGYCPKPSKIILAVHPDNLEARKRFGLSYGFKVCTGARYIGGFIKDDESKHEWLKVRMSKWKRSICKISKTAGRNPQ